MENKIQSGESHKFVSSLPHSLKAIWKKSHQKVQLPVVYQKATIVFTAHQFFKRKVLFSTNKDVFSRGPIIYYICCEFFFPKITTERLI